ncbi:hypothetical protein R1C46_10970 [Bacillus tropicus]
MLHSAEIDCLQKVNEESGVHVKVNFRLNKNSHITNRETATKQPQINNK